MYILFFLFILYLYNLFTYYIIVLFMYRCIFILFYMFNLWIVYNYIVCVLFYFFIFVIFIYNFFIWHIIVIYIYNCFFSIVCMLVYTWYIRASDGGGWDRAGDNADARPCAHTHYIEIARYRYIWRVMCLCVGIICGVWRCPLSAWCPLYNRFIYTLLPFYGSFTCFLLLSQPIWYPPLPIFQRAQPA